MSRFLADKYLSLKEYVPGEQPKGRSYIKLNTNESPFPPSQGVIDGINCAQVKSLRLYPDPDASELKEALAREYGVKPQNIFVANGSDDILNFSFMAFSQEGAAYADITYGFYKVFAKLHGVESEIIPLEDDLTLNAKKYIEKNKLIVIANPNAPTGLCISLEEIEEIAKTNPDNVVVIDEAYVDFGGESAAKLTEKYSNLLVVMTYSKSRSLAGARLGFAIANAELIADLDRIRNSTNPYNVNRLTQIAGIKAIEESDYYKTNCQEIIEAREYTKRELKSLGFDYTNSKANFIFAKSPDIGGEELYLKLKDKGILVRHFNDERICEYIRVSIGTLSDMEKFVGAVKEILNEKS